jgi:hypothetical protein
MSLTPAELAAARAFRGMQRRALDGGRGGPPDITADVHVRYIRHDCAKQGGKSVSLELREHYVFSPDYHACDCGEVCCPASAHLVECDTCGPVPIVPAKRFGWIFTEGRCSACGMTARSKTGRLVDPAERPPSEHAIVA